VICDSYAAHGNKKKRQRDITPDWYLIAAARFHFDMHHTGNCFDFQLNYDKCAGRRRGVRKDNSVYSGRGIRKAGEIYGGWSLRGLREAQSPLLRNCS